MIEPPEWDVYVSSFRLELAPWCIFATSRIRRGQYEPLRFFTDYNKIEKPNSTNMWMPGMLPNPRGFLIKYVKIFGLASSMSFSVFELTIGNKIWSQHPAWLVGPRPGMQLNPNLFIPPLVAWRGLLKWDGAADLGIGFNGHSRLYADIQVALIGKMARSLV